MLNSNNVYNILFHVGYAHKQCSPWAFLYKTTSFIHHHNLGTLILVICIYHSILDRYPYLDEEFDSYIFRAQPRATPARVKPFSFSSADIDIFPLSYFPLTRRWHIRLDHKNKLTHNQWSYEHAERWKLVSR